MNKRLTRISKYMSFILSHESKSIGLKLDAEGWADVQEFVEKANATGKSVTAEQVMTVVAENDKQRFELSEDQSRVRAVVVSRKAIRKQTRQAAAKPVKKETPKPEPAAPIATAPVATAPAAPAPAPALETAEPKQAEKAAPAKTVFTRSRIVQRNKTT